MSKKLLFVVSLVMVLLIIFLVSLNFLISNGNPLKSVQNPFQPKPVQSPFQLEDGTPLNEGYTLIDDGNILVQSVVKLKELTIENGDLSMNAEIKPGKDQKFLVYKKDWAFPFYLIRGNVPQVFVPTDKSRVDQINGLDNIKKALEIYNGKFVFIYFSIKTTHTNDPIKDNLQCNSQIWQYLSGKIKSYSSCNGAINQLKVYEPNN